MKINKAFINYYEDSFQGTTLIGGRKIKRSKAFYYFSTIISFCFLSISGFWKIYFEAFMSPEAGLDSLISTLTFCLFVLFITSSVSFLCLYILDDKSVEIQNLFIAGVGYTGLLSSILGFILSIVFYSLCLHDFANSLGNPVFDFTKGISYHVIAASFIFILLTIILPLVVRCSRVKTTFIS